MPCRNSPCTRHRIVGGTVPLCTVLHLRCKLTSRQWIRIDFGRLDPDPGRQKLPTQLEKSEEVSCFEVLDVLLWGLTTDVLFGGLGINTLQFLIKNF